jgi:phosphoglucosamine mutase
MLYNLFGTDGIRNTVGKPPFIQSDLIKLGHAIAQWVLSLYGANTTILIATDTRQSCDFIKATIQSSLLHYSFIIADAGIAPIGAVSKIIADSQHWAIALIISASHNPYHDNGIKIIRADTGKLSLRDEQDISSHFYQQHFAQICTHLGTLQPISSLFNQYHQLLKQFFPANFSLTGMRIVLDCAYGACSPYAPEIFKLFGADVLALHTRYTGTNINEQCGAVYPAALQRTVVDDKADIGFAFDGDGDRVIAVNHDGMIKDGDDILALLTNHPAYAQQQTIVATSMSNQGLHDYLAHTGKTLVRTAVGDKYVLQELQARNLLLGAEQSGHVMLRDYSNSGDGIFAALRIAQTIQITGNTSFTTFTKYPQLAINIPVTHKKDLLQEPINNHIKTHEQHCKAGRLLVRYSGTENVLRLMIEHPDEKQARSIITSLATILHKELS